MTRLDPLHRRVAVITGASRGIGAAVARELAPRGVGVALVARSASQLEEVAASIAQEFPGAVVLPLACDVTEKAAVAALPARVYARLGPVDLLINNAGSAESSGSVLWEADVDDWWRVMEVNLLGPVRMVRAFAPEMVLAGAGRIVNFTSMRGFVNTPTHTAYAASKAALTRTTESLNVALRGTGVLAFGYSPGRVATGLARSMEASDVTDAASWTPMETAVRGLVGIAEGRFDRMAGRLIHARDLDLGLDARADEVIAKQGRRAVLSPAFEGDPVARIGASSDT